MGKKKAVSGTAFMVYRAENGYQVFRELTIKNGEVQEIKDHQPCTQSDVMTKVTLKVRAQIKEHNSQPTKVIVPESKATH